MKAPTALLLISVNLFGQNPNNAEKKDTVVVPVYEKYDTLKVTILYRSTGNIVKYSDGYAVLKGFAVQEKGQWKWAERPAVVAYLDEKKKTLNNVITVF